MGGLVQQRMLIYRRRLSRNPSEMPLTDNTLCWHPLFAKNRAMMTEADGIHAVPLVANAEHLLLTC
ncbi:MAG: hypothetical protein ACR2RE_00675 [Geminicoccaceae bacterium]